MPSHRDICGKYTASYLNDARRAVKRLLNTILTIPQSKHIPIAAVPPSEQLIASPAVQHIVPIAPSELIHSQPAYKNILADPTVQHIIPIAAVQHIVPVFPEELIISSSPRQVITSSASPKNVSAITTI
jgi:hypothetical protein